MAGLQGLEYGVPIGMAGSARLHVVAMLAAVRRTDRHAHAFAQPVWGLMRPHVDHIDFEIRVQRIVIDHGERNILTAFAGTFETG